MVERNIFHVRGDTMSFNIRLIDFDGDLTGAYFGAKTSYTAEEYAFLKALGDGIEKVEDGVYVVRLAPEDTADLDPQSYCYDVRIEANTDVYTVLRGIMTLVDDVSQIGG